MADKFQNKYRIPSARLKDWDYGSNSIYYVAICTKHREHCFGEIVDGKMILNEIGESAQNFWMEIPNHFPFVKLGAFVVMPNHVHGMIEINKNDGRVAIYRDCMNSNDAMKNKDAINRISTGGITKNKNPMLHQNLSRIIRWYKGRITFESRKTKPNFEWQTRFHDHIVRNFDSYHRIEQYIENNPDNWKNDELYES